MYPFDQPLFCAVQRITIQSRQGSRHPTQARPEAPFSLSRTRILDSLPLTLLACDKWGEGKYYQWKWLRAPLCRTLLLFKDSKASAFQILESPCFTFIHYSDIREQYFGYKPQKETYVLASSFLFARSSFFERKTSAEVGDRWCLGKTPVGILVNSQNRADTSHFALFETTRIFHDWSTFALWRTERENKETLCRQALRLPLIGPVWAAWEDKDEARWGIFPRLFFWKKFRH
jgi:hypothetical protein